MLCTKTLESLLIFMVQSIFCASLVSYSFGCSIVQLPTLLAHTNMDPEGVNILRDTFSLILEYYFSFNFKIRFLVENMDRFFSRNYDLPDPAYVNAFKAQVSVA